MHLLQLLPLGQNLPPRGRHRLQAAGEPGRHLGTIIIIIIIIVVVIINDKVSLVKYH